MSLDKILLTGATGHIGPFVVGELLNNNYDVRALVLPHEKESLPGLQKYKGDIEVVSGDIRNPDDLNRAFKDVDAGINMAAIIGIYGHKKEVRELLRSDDIKNPYAVAVYQKLQFVLQN